MNPVSIIKVQREGNMNTSSAHGGQMLELFGRFTYKFNHPD